MFAAHALYLSFVIATKRGPEVLSATVSAVRTNLRGTHNELWNVTDTYPTDASKSCYAWNQSHWACADDVDLLHDVSPDDSY